MGYKKQINKITKSIKEGVAPVGIFVFTRDVSVIEVIGDSGFDFIIIDAEHTRLNGETLEHQIMAAQLHDVTPIVRVPDNIPYMIRHAMEAGALGVAVPHITSREDCRRAQEALRFAPYGKAGMCPTIRATSYNVNYWDEHVETVNEISLIAMIEDPIAMNDLDGILDELKPGRDLVLFGKADFSQGLAKKEQGMLVDLNNPETTVAFKKVVEECIKRKISVMASPYPGLGSEDIRNIVTDGGQAIILDTDLMLLHNSFRKILGRAKGINLNSKSLV
ncbi:HpcH/HpaI aldolase family protein [Bacillus sp. FJAT-29937]|uniref:HpcH/HpaI aldolase family protein n=1 Tax=Bacillus sp. FJAT-29937 TaxID=1720553 RepID=UPI000836A902|nr:aldolase/citrate lyase family protein [Bacillus sp. FJAT-29937]